MEDLSSNDVVLFWQWEADSGEKIADKLGYTG